MGRDVFHPAATDAVVRGNSAITAIGYFWLPHGAELPSLEFPLLGAALRLDFVRELGHRTASKSPGGAGFSTPGSYLKTAARMPVRAAVFVLGQLHRNLQH